MMKQETDLEETNLYLTYNKEDYSHGSTSQRDQHQEFKAEDQALNVRE